MLKITDDIYQSIDNGSFVASVSLDISAAFDTIDHTILCNRLQSSFNVIGTVLKWFHSYISGQSGYVKVGQTFSALAINSSGVPRGSVLGPILLRVYIAPIGRIVDAYNDVSYHTYDDDTQLYVRLKDAGCMTALVACLRHLQHWFRRNMLLLNGSKSDAIMVRLSLWILKGNLSYLILFSAQHNVTLV